MHTSHVIVLALAGTFKHRKVSCAEVPVTTGCTVKGWLGREQSEAGENVSSMPHQLHGSEVESLQSLPRQRLDEERLCTQLQQQFRTGVQVLLQPPEATLNHPGHAAHMHLPGRDVHASHARWFVLPEESSLVVDASAGTNEAARHAGVAYNATGSWKGSTRAWARQQTVPDCDTAQRSVSQGKCRRCHAPSGRLQVSSSSGSDRTDHRQQEQVHSQPVRNDRSSTPSASRGCREQVQAVRSMESGHQGQYKARPSSGTLTGVRSREPRLSHKGTSRVRVDTREGGSQPASSRATGRLAAAVVCSSAKVKRMNDSDRARAAIAAGKAALAASMRRRQLRSCPPR